MVDVDAEDTLTKLNTQLNKSMVLMDHTANDEIPVHKSAKTIKINTRIQPASPANGSSNVSRKSILKRTDKSKVGKENVNDSQSIESELERINQESQQRLTASHTVEPRPHNLQDFVDREGLTMLSMDSTFEFDNLSDDDEIWIMEIPRTINPMLLKGQTLTLGEKSKFQVNEERYYAARYPIKSHVTCVVNSGDVNQQYKTVNIKPAGAIAIRKKLSSHVKIKPMNVENSGVPFPTNLRTRHPLLGVSEEGKVRKSTGRRSR